MTHKIKALCKNCGLLLAINRKKLGQFKKTCRRCGTIHEGEIKMSGHDPEEDISTTVAVSFIADLESSLVRALGQEEEYRRRLERVEQELSRIKAAIKPIANLTLIDDQESLTCYADSKGGQRSRIDLVDYIQRVLIGKEKEKPSDTE